jgi:hypothetical protein
MTALERDEERPTFAVDEQKSRVGPESGIGA